jgi:hypothetical protein
MKFIDSVVPLLALLGATSTIAAPLEARSIVDIKPTIISQYKVSSGAVTYNTQKGKIFKDGHSSDVTTLVTFNIPANAKGKKCDFIFSLDATAILSGSKLFDIFTSQAPPTQSTTDWPQGNLRGNQLGRMKATKPGDATVEWQISNKLTSADCETGLIYRELVGVYDVDHIEWSKNLAGPKIRIHY